VLIAKRFLAILAVAAMLGSVLWAPPGWTAPKTIVVVGDSLSSGYGLTTEQSWVSLLKQRLKAQGYGYQVVNASIAGDTSAGGRSRLSDLIVRHMPSIVVIELGGNDGLRGQPAVNLRKNLAQLIDLSQHAGAKVLLLGVRMPPNYGPQYTEAFADVYSSLADEYHVALVGFLLQGVALHPELMQADGIHPNAQGQTIVFQNVWPVLKTLL
jgi:acyl-CoA thioesterase-1